MESENPTDMMTKYIEKPLLEEILLKMNMLVLDGLEACAPATAGC